MTTETKKEVSLPSLPTVLSISFNLVSISEDRTMRRFS